MPGLVPGIHGMRGESHHAVDGRDKPGHDESVRLKVLAPQAGRRMRTPEKVITVR